MNKNDKSERVHGGTASSQEHLSENIIDSNQKKKGYTKRIDNFKATFLNINNSNVIACDIFRLFSFEMEYF